MALVVILGLAAIRMRRASERAGAPRLTPAPASIEVATAASGRVETRESFLGPVVAGEEAPLSARMISQVMNVAVREGDPVRAGQPLVELDARELEDAVAAQTASVAAAGEARLAAEVAFEAQEQSTARDKVLVAAEAISRDEWERSQAAEAGARARLRAAEGQVVAATKALASAQTRRGYATLRAPFDAVVSVRHVNPGDLAAPGKPLVTLVRTGSARVRARIPAELVQTLGARTRVALQGPAGERRLPISRVFPAMDASHLGTIEVDAPSGLPLLVGSTLTIDLLQESEVGLVVPAAALLETSGGARVFVVTGTRVRPVAVAVLGCGRAEAAVRGEIDPGARVALGTPARLAMLTAEEPVQVVGGR